jgi:hypothetical protein
MSQQNVEMIERIFDQAPYDPAVLFESLDDEVHWEVGAIDIPILELRTGTDRRALERSSGAGSAHSTIGASSSTRRST